MGTTGLLEELMMLSMSGLLAFLIYASMVCISPYSYNNLYISVVQNLISEGSFWVCVLFFCSGHRIGTAEVESALVSHPQCAEAAVVGIEHEVGLLVLVC